MADPLIADVLTRTLDTDQNPIPGARDFIPQKAGVVFRVNASGPNKAQNGATHVQVKLNNTQTYDIGFFKFRPDRETLTRVGGIPDIPLDMIGAAVVHEARIGS